MDVKGLTSAGGPDNQVLLALQRTGGENPKIKLNELNAARIIGQDERLAGRIWYDELARDEVLDGHRIEDVVEVQIQIWIQEVYGLDFSREKIRGAIRAVARERRLHPVRVYLESLDWDGESRLDQWLSAYLGVEDTPLTRAYGRKWLLQACWRALRPGCQADATLIFYSPGQGRFKSSAIETLCGSDWFGDKPLDIKTPERYGQDLRGKWLFELAELSSLGKREAEEIKHFLTIRVDDYRAAYDARNGRHPRTVVFCGTTNSAAIVLDPTGSRRFWIVQAGVLFPRTYDPRPALYRDRDQLWAEAMHQIRTLCDYRSALEMTADSFRDWSMRIDERVRWWLSPEEEELREQDADRWSIEDPWLDKLREVLAGRFVILNSELLEALGVETSRAQGVSRRITPLMACLGWERYRRNGYAAWRPSNRA